MSPSVLIVDDSLTVRMDLADAFEAAGFQAMPRATIAEAREALAAENIGLVVLDVLLPDGDGIDLLREIRLSPGRRQLPVILLSSETEVKDRIRGLKTGADEYVGKPYDLNYVIQRAHELLRQARPPAPRSASVRETVLVIEDSVTFRERIREALEDAGYAVLCASTGEEGLRIAASARAHHEW